MPRYLMAIDASKCLNCKACLLACQQQNNVPFGQFRNWVHVTPNDNEAASFSYQPGNCMQCADPICVQACPTSATYKDVDGVIKVDKDRCIGCSSCVKACPYHARHIDPTHKVVDKCDYCAAARADGLEPACVRICITRTRKFGDIDDPSSEISKYLEKEKAKGLNFVEATETKTQPTLTYVGNVYPSDWPENVKIPTPIHAMNYIGTGVRWLGGLSLFGVIAVFIKQIFLPSADSDAHDKHETPSEPEAKDKNKSE